MPSGVGLRLPPPPGQLLADPLASDTGGLIESENLINRYGSLRSRPGMTQVGGALLGGHPVVGSFFVRDKQGLTGSIQLVVGTTATWWHLNNGTVAWDDLSAGGGPPLTGNFAPVIFTYFEQGGNQYIIGVNDKNPAIEWQVGAAPPYAAVATGYIARSVCTVANRLFYGNVTIGGTRFPTMVAWSSPLDRTSNPALARQPLLDTADHIITVRRMGRTAAVIYREWSQWLATAQANDDANAFAFTVQDRQPGPIGPAAVAEGPGLRHTYFGSDLNLYSFDGNSATIIAATADVLRTRFNSSARFLVNAVYSPNDQEVWVSLPLSNEPFPTHVMVYSFQTGGVFFQRWQDHPTTMLGLWQQELETPTDALPDIPTDHLPDVPTDQLGLLQLQTVLITGTQVGTTVSVNTLDGVSQFGQPISYLADLLLPIRDGDYEFDGVNLMVEEPDVSLPITVSVLYGQSYDSLTTLVLGIVDPTIPSDQEAVAGGPNKIELRTTEASIRARIIRIQLTVQAAVAVNIRRLEVLAWPRQRMA